MTCEVQSLVSDVRQGNGATSASETASASSGGAKLDSSQLAREIEQRGQHREDRKANLECLQSPIRFFGASRLRDDDGELNDGGVLRPRNVSPGNGPRSPLVWRDVRNNADDLYIGFCVRGLSRKQLVSENGHFNILRTLGNFGFGNEDVAFQRLGRMR
ncbi:hypothetical protein BD410DRAFT_809838 [Rickenella mellea]|uniref:Uncharacterized protein n=1 Tax=Rickenella mellea TaxID=50990 RepID=A0A4Y7PID7_9AGAM|nr:hypothetical protein BD410DRAFT_809838 [Rickenella mellea]